MKYPKTGSARQYRLTIPQMDGAVNRVSAPPDVKDNQPVDTCNMWWHDGALRTRPGFRVPEESLVDYVTFSEGIFYGSNEVLCPSEADVPVYGRQFYIQRGSTVQEVLTIGYDGKVRPFYSKDGQTKMGYARGISQRIYLIPYGSVSYTRDGQDYRGDGVIVWDLGQLYGLPESGGDWVSLTDQLYTPLIVAEATGYQWAEDHPESCNGTLNESFNLLSRKFRVQFTTSEDTDVFYLPEKNLNTGYEVRVSLTDKNGDAAEYVIPKGSSKIKAKEGLYLYVDREKGFLRFDSGETTEGGAYVPVHVGQRNNMEVTAYITGNHALAHMITHMTTFRWFGGDRSGLSHGTRLFAAGNTDSDYANVVMWSDLNNPLYWPENNYARIGDNTQAVTALAQQGNTLVIFKEREIYYSEYIGNTIDPEDVVDGNIVDVVVNAAYFPITPISSDVGCDCPDTICLCSNHLVWANSRKKVYVLTSRNQYSDSNVQEISANIEPLLSGIPYSSMASASAGVYQGYYYLLADNRIFALNFDDSSFVYIAYNGTYKTDTSKIVWYVWEFLNAAFRRIIAGREGVMLAGQTQLTESRLVHGYYLMDGDADTRLALDDGENIVLMQESIHGYVQTKILDFDAPESLKSVMQVYVGLSGTSQSEVSFTYLTEAGEQKDPYQIVKFGEEHENRNRYLSVYRLTPNVVRVKCFGMKIDGNGSFAISRVIVKYKPLGGTR